MKKIFLLVLHTHALMQNEDVQSSESTCLKPNLLEKTSTAFLIFACSYDDLGFKCSDSCIQPITTRARVLP